MTAAPAIAQAEAVIADLQAQKRLLLQQAGEAGAPHPAILNGKVAEINAALFRLYAQVELSARAAAAKRKVVARHE